MNRRPSSTKVRRECFDRCKYTDPVTGRIMMTCHICGLPIDPVRQKWEADHVTRRSLKGDDSPSNILPAHKTDCHSEKSRRDISDHAKGVRVRDRHFNIKQSSGFGWSKKFRRKVSGEVVER